jgi:hypothetical protein
VSGSTRLSATERLAAIVQILCAMAYGSLHRSRPSNTRNKSGRLYLARVRQDPVAANSEHLHGKGCLLRRSLHALCWAIGAVLTKLPTPHRTNEWCSLVAFLLLSREGKAFTGSGWFLSCRLVHLDTKAEGKVPELKRLVVAIVAQAVASLSQKGLSATSACL